MKPILFNTDMIEAILDNKKTKTRRVIKFPTNRFTHNIPMADNLTVKHIRDDRVTFHESPHFCFNINKPYKVGDILYVRESYAIGSIEYGEESYNPEPQPYISQCEGDNDIIHKEWALRNHIGIDDVKWKPSIHMPKDAARLFLRVTAIKVERLQDMTLDDFLDEGIEVWPQSFNDPSNAYLQAKKSFSNLWNSTINKSQLGLYGWDANPYVWIIEFEKTDKPSK